MRVCNFLAAAVLAACGMTATGVSAQIYCDEAQNAEFWQDIDALKLGACFLSGEKAGRDIDGHGIVNHPKSQSSDYRTLLEAAIMHSSKPYIIRDILREGADPNYLRHEMNADRPLGSAGMNPDPEAAKEIIQILLEFDADPNAEVKNGQPAYYRLTWHFGGQNINKQTMEHLDYLASIGADFSMAPRHYSTGENLGWFNDLIIANAELNVFERLYDEGGGDPTYIDHWGRTYLHMIGEAADHISADVIEWFVAHGVDPLAKNSDGKYAWELVEHDARLAGALQKVAGIDTENGIPGLANSDGIARACRSEIIPQMLMGSGASVTEVCDCVVKHGPMRYDRISNHPHFDNVYGALTLRKQLQKVVQDTGFICAALWSTSP